MAWLAGNHCDGRLDHSKDQMAHTMLTSTRWGLSQLVKSSPLSLSSGKLQAGNPGDSSNVSSEPKNLKGSHG